VSMHRSEFAQRSFSKVLELEGSMHPGWAPEVQGLVPVTEASLVRQLQEMLTATHKREDNWTRDRGCRLHGVNACAAACASKNRCPVPTGYTLVSVFRNQNTDMWQKYSFVKAAISEECASASKVPMSAVSVASNMQLDMALETTCNEWRCFHGTGAEACKDICASNFRLDLAGQGATWKDIGAEKGTPLYGFGIYFAERITKADEYTEATVDGLFSMLVCRVVAGRTNIITSNEIDPDKLRADVYDGPYHSVLGDRVVTLGKPYREIVVYDKDQVFPEFLLMYTRSYT